MRTKYKYIQFELVEEKPKTQVWWCKNIRSGSVLATIKWYSAWRQYCFFPEYDTVFNQSCMEDVIDFIRQLKGIREDKSRT